MVRLLTLFALFGLFYYLSTFGCWWVLSFASIFAAMIWHQLLAFKRDINTFACPFCHEGSLCERFCRSVWLFGMVSAVMAIVMALSVMAFLTMMHPYFWVILFLDLFFFYTLMSRWNVSKSNQLKPQAMGIVGQLVVNMLNVALLTVAIMGVDWSVTPHHEIDAELFAYINAHVTHACTIFQHLLRTQAFLEHAIFGLRAIEGVGQWLFGFFYIASLSFFPLLGITLLYKFGLTFGAKE
ncbi:MAG: hypothetical protein KU28_01890 [Sulfurovum sp. PC08-66]|nr:MAG: hypothetical protein KU28_01890 [Sulfurovum sp. PC08-66]KIM12682.1 MAG: hypothetical protein KU37_01995 [Sulfuricurvum sp. PC08-66]